MFGIKLKVIVAMVTELCTHSNSARACNACHATEICIQHTSAQLLSRTLLWFLIVTCSCCPYLYFGSPIMLVTYFNKFYVAEWPPVWERAIHSVYRACLSKTAVNLCIYLFPFWFRGQDVGSDCVGS